MLLDKLTDDMRSAMKSGQKLRAQVLRMIMSDCKYARVEKMRELDDADVLQVLKRGIKSREDSESQYRAAGRIDLADKERDEAAILKTYLPEALSGPELEAAVDQAIRETGAGSPRDMGKVMKAVLAAHGPRVDGREVQKLVQAKLSPG